MDAPVHLCAKFCNTCISRQAKTGLRKNSPRKSGPRCNSRAGMGGLSRRRRPCKNSSPKILGNPVCQIWSRFLPRNPKKRKMRYLIKHRKTGQERTVTQAAWAKICENRQNPWGLVSTLNEEIPPEALESQPQKQPKPRKRNPRPAVPGGEV